MRSNCTNNRQILFYTSVLEFNPNQSGDILHSHMMRFKLTPADEEKAQTNFEHTIVIGFCVEAFFQERPLYYFEKKKLLYMKVYNYG